MKNSDIAQPKLIVGSPRCQCGACGRYFTSPSSFDAHRAGTGKERRCVDPSSLLTKDGKARFRLSGNGLWTRNARSVQERSAQS